VVLCVVVLVGVVALSCNLFDLLSFLPVFTTHNIKHSYHEGMRVYTMLFHESWKTLRDFIPWFLLLMMTQAWFIALLYSGAGTNTDMLYIGGSLSVVLRLVFGFYDYDAFISNSVGLGSATYIGAVVFWVCVGLGIVVAQNVMLAIVTQACTL